MSYPPTLASRFSTGFLLSPLSCVNPLSLPSFHMSNTNLMAFSYVLRIVLVDVRCGRAGLLEVVASRLESGAQASHRRLVGERVPASCRRKPSTDLPVPLSWIAGGRLRFPGEGGVPSLCYRGFSLHSPLPSRSPVRHRCTSWRARIGRRPYASSRAAGW